MCWILQGFCGVRIGCHTLGDVPEELAEIVHQRLLALLGVLGAHGHHQAARRRRVSENKSVVIGVGVTMLGDMLVENLGNLGRVNILVQRFVH